MPIKITQLPAVDSAAPEDLLPLVDASDSVTKKVTIAQILALGASGSGDPISLGTGTKPNIGNIRVAAPAAGSGNARVLIAQRKSDGTGDLKVVSLHEGPLQVSSVVFGDPGHSYTTLVGQTVFLASQQGPFGGATGSYFGVRPDGLAFVSLSGGANKQIEFSSNIITDYAIELSPDVGGVVEWKTSAPVTNYRCSFYRGGAPVRWLDASSALITLGYALANVVPIRLDAKEVRQGNSTDNLRTTFVLDQVQTTDGTTWVDLFSLDLVTNNNDALSVLEFEAQGIRSTAASAAVLKKRRAFRMNTGTLTSLVEATLQSDVAELAGDARLTAVGTVVKAQVKGVAATTIDWTGAIISAKTKASGAAAFVPTSVGTCALWLRADLGVTQDAGPVVSAWANQSSGGDANKNASAAGAARPGYTASNANYNGRPTINFTNAAHRLATGIWAAAVSQRFRVIMVGRAISSGSNAYWFESLNGASHVRENNAAGLLAFAGTVLADGSTNAPSVVLVDFNGASTVIKNNKRSASVTGVAGAGGLTGMYIGNESGSGGFLNGELAELIVYSALSTVEETAVLDYLESRYLITLAP